jgi:sterol desaturase/sphingolipid hydroxylase (fatty acid hydroxylase superfamily)
MSPRAFAWWQAWFFVSVLFHHSNLRLPARAEHVLSRVLTTPRMHGIHHMAARGATDSNWSSGLALWDHLHGTFRCDIEADELPQGVPGYRGALRLGELFSLPFRRQRDAWRNDRG